MARLSKTHQFTIYEDLSIPEPDIAESCTLEASAIVHDTEFAIEESEEEAGTLVVGKENSDGELEAGRYGEQDGDDADDERRQSTWTTVSSLPESASESDHEVTNLPPSSCTTPFIQRTHHRIDHIQRVQITKSPRFGAQSPRHSLLHHFRSRSGTPRSARSINAKGSPRPRKRISEATETLDDEQQYYPLVLLHVTLLPIDLPWSAHSMHELLPSKILHNLQLLRSKISNSVSTRGILIPHPKEEYELLEERLLEALNLIEERVTKCGHFNANRLSNSGSDGEGASDSGVGSSVDGSDGEMCATCHDRLKTSKMALGYGSKKWSIRIFAANGLLCPSAWAAAWQDMESVDVEILPWIGENIRRELDVRKIQEGAEKEAEQQEEAEERIRRIVEDEIQQALEEQKVRNEVERRKGPRATATMTGVARRAEGTVEEDAPLRCGDDTLPRIYQPSEIPLTILLRNYIYLLAQDWRNVATFFFGMAALFALTITASLDRLRLFLHDDVDTSLVLSTSRSRVAQSDMINVVNWFDESVHNASTQDETYADSAASVMTESNTPGVREEQCSIDWEQTYIDDGIKELTCPAELEGLSDK